MDELILTCSCGHQQRISVYAVGMAGACEGCGRRIQASEENTSAPTVEQPSPAQQLSPAEQLSPSQQPNPVEVAPAVDTPRPPDTCPQCGNAYRGDWDRVETRRGIVCHHCSVLATEAVPDLTHLTGPAELDIEETPNLQPPPKMLSIGPWTVDPESDSFKRWVTAAGFVVIVMTIVLVLTDDYTGPGGGEIIEPKEIPRYLTTLYAIWQLVIFYLSVFSAIYLVLYRELKLPKNTFWANAFHIAHALLAVTLILAAAGGVSFALSFIPVAGMIIGRFLILPLGGMASIMALMKILDFDVKDFFLLILFFALTQILAQAITAAVWAPITAAIL